MTQTTQDEAGRRGTCLIIGAGDGVGSAAARAFATQGYTVCVTRRPRHADALRALAGRINDSGGRAVALPSDARDEAEVTALFDAVEAHGPLQVCLFNIGANVRFTVLDTTARVYTKVWEMAAFAGFLAGREAARRMVPRGQGTMLFTGATASLRGRDGFSAFAGAKHALRALAQSMARELGPQGIHVAHVIVDGLIDGSFARANFPDIDARLAAGEVLDPAEIAKSFVFLTQQHRCAWTHEMDLRPWKESF